MERSTSGRQGIKPVYASEITSPEFGGNVARGALVILPVGSLEEHGSHLPLGTDSLQAEEVVRRVAERVGAVVLPPVPYGECRSTRNFPGTISVSFETVRSIAFDILTELSRNGARDVMVLSGHAGSGHMAALKLAAHRAVESDPGMRVMVLSDYDIAYELRGKEFSADDGHAGQIETSRILNIRPELVREDRPSGSGRPPKFMVLSNPEEYIPSGVMGNSKGASADRGERIDDYVVDILCGLVEENFGPRKGGR